MQPELCSGHSQRMFWGPGRLRAATIAFRMPISDKTQLLVSRETGSDAFMSYKAEVCGKLPHAAFPALRTPTACDRITVLIPLGGSGVGPGTHRYYRPTCTLVYVWKGKEKGQYCSSSFFHFCLVLLNILSCFCYRLLYYISSFWTDEWENRKGKGNPHPQYMCIENKLWNFYLAQRISALLSLRVETTSLLKKWSPIEIANRYLIANSQRWFSLAEHKAKLIGLNKIFHIVFSSLHLFEGSLSLFVCLIGCFPPSHHFLVL